MSPGTSFEHISISLPQGHSMPNINAFRKVVHEKKIVLRFINIFLILPLLGQPLDLNKSESPFARDTSYQIWLKSD